METAPLGHHYGAGEATALSGETLTFQPLPVGPQATVAPPVARVPAAGLYARGGKRAFDLALVLLTAPLWLPIYAITALVLLLAQGPPIHFRAERVGRHGELFKIIKFRSMRPDAHAELTELLSSDPDLHEEYRLRVKLRADPRVTRIGGVIRRWGLDELPQLWNVVLGDMSIVGPRPVEDKEWHERYGAEGPYCFGVRPGATGLWQVSRGEGTTYEERVAMDVEYRSRCSLRADLAILVRTPASLKRAAH